MAVEIIAEVAQGYEGDPSQARLLARGAVRAGADAVKFQLIYADEIATPDYHWYNLFRTLEMSREAWQTIVEETHTGGSRFYLDVYGERSLRDAIELGVDGVKIHTTDFFNTRLIQAVLKAIPRVFISLGGVAVGELADFLERYKISPQQNICFMYGFQAEPTPIEANNLRRLTSLQQRFPGYQFGFMDHAVGNSNEAMALSLLTLSFGVSCIEKHISLDRILELEDYVSALTPEQFSEFVKRIKHLEQALGSDSLDLTLSEQEYRYKAMKVVVANQALTAGDVVTAAQLSLKRTSHPDPSTLFHQIEQVVNCKLTADVQPNQAIIKEMLL